MCQERSGWVAAVTAETCVVIHFTEEIAIVFSLANISCIGSGNREVLSPHAAAPAVAAHWIARGRHFREDVS